MGWGFGTAGIRDNRDKEERIMEEKRAGIFAWDQETVLRKHCTTTTKRGAHDSDTAVTCKACDLIWETPN